MSVLVAGQLETPGADDGAGPAGVARAGYRRGELVRVAAACALVTGHRVPLWVQTGAEGR
ncbi:hypothetical protein [Streptomyces sp. NPDC090083]|uniref:hypothetical protein n=1 Tax=Streptomyces sp. NPDC090083 TaxID=3365941 RepID=UPI003802EC66